MERLVGEIDAANEAMKLAQDELLAAQVTLNHETVGLLSKTLQPPPNHGEILPPPITFSAKVICFTQGITVY